MSYSLVNWRDVREMGGGQLDSWSDNRLKLLPMVGYAYRENGVLQGIGAVVWLGRRAEGMFTVREDFRLSTRSRWVHRRALEVLAAAHLATPLIHATADLAIPRSQVWIERLGFQRLDGENWVHGLVCGSGQSGGVVSAEPYRSDLGGEHSADSLRTSQTRTG